MNYNRITTSKFSDINLIWTDRDNEKPTRKVKVHGFQAKGRAITNEEVGREKQHP